MHHQLTYQNFGLSYSIDMEIKNKHRSRLIIIKQRFYYLQVCENLNSSLFICFENYLYRAETYKLLNKHAFTVFKVLIYVFLQLKLV